MAEIEIQASHIAYATVARAETVPLVLDQLVLVEERLDLRVPSFERLSFATMLGTTRAAIGGPRDRGRGGQQAQHEGQEKAHG